MGIIQFQLDLKPDLNTIQLSDKKTLVLGCSGQDGSLISLSLLKKGHHVIGGTRKKSKKITNHIKLGIEKDIEVIKCDIRNYSDLEKTIKEYQPQTIYNLAGQSSVGKSFIQPVETLESIVNGSLNILQIAKKIKYEGKIFFAGSSEIFGNVSSKADINHKQNPISPYAISKQTSYNLVKLFRDVYGIQCMTGIFFNHESELRSTSFVTQKIIKTVDDIYKHKQKTLTIGNWEIIRDWGWAEEYVEATQLITESKKVKDYVICTGNPYSLKTFIKKVFAKYNLDWSEFIVVDKNLFRSNEIMRSCGDPEPLYKEQGWKAKMGIDSIIERMIEKIN